MIREKKTANDIPQINNSKISKNTKKKTGNIKVKHVHHRKLQNRLN